MGRLRHDGTPVFAARTPVIGRESWRISQCNKWTAARWAGVVRPAGINQTHDPNSFYGNATRTQRLLANAVLLSQESYGHLYFQDPSRCVEDAMAAYLTELTTPLNGSVCQSNQTPFEPAF